jgi:hypothetical protein
MPLNFIDLFVGAMYFSVRLKQAGITPIKHVDDNKDDFETIFNFDHFFQIIIKHL